MALITQPKGDLEGGEFRSRSHRQEYFDRGFGYTEYNDDVHRRDRAQRHLQQNTSQELRVTPHFNVAMLLYRESDACFEGVFRLRVGEGAWVTAKQWAKQIFGYPKDDPVNFDPARDPEGKEWARLEDHIPLDHMASLVDEDKLTKLVGVWGVELATFQEVREPAEGEADGDDAEEDEDDHEDVVEENDEGEDWKDGGSWSQAYFLS